MVVFLRIFLKSFHTKLRFFFKLSEVQGANNSPPQKNENMWFVSVFQNNFDLFGL